MKSCRPPLFSALQMVSFALAVQVSREEFHEAMEALGLEAPKKDIDGLFTEWDPDGSGVLPSLEFEMCALRVCGPPPTEQLSSVACTDSGAIDFKEMQKILRKGQSEKATEDWSKVRRDFAPNPGCPHADH